MRNHLSRFSGFMVSIVKSPKFFYAVVVLLVLQAVWIALTARYPQAFDENYHLGLIQLHAGQWLPYFTYQPPGAEVHGAVVRDASYLFHYLLSIPYRLLLVMTENENVRIIILRLINVGIFVAGLFVYRRLLDELRISVGVRNIVLLVFVLLPVVPLLAAQINYDNLMFVICGLLFLYVTRFIQYMRDRKPAAPLIPVGLALQILLVGGIGSIVKYAFTPIFLATMASLVAAVIFYYRITRIKPKLTKGLADVRRPAKLVILSVATLVVLALCFERYGVNIVQYGTPVPKCDKVLTVEQCKAYSPWVRDYIYAQAYPRPTALGYAVYPFVWFHRMEFETMFTITSYTQVPDGPVTYAAYSPLRVAQVTTWVVMAIGIAGALVYWRRIRANRPLTVLLGIIGFYTIVLFLQNLAMYHHSGEAVAIHGRYLVPVYPVLLLALAIGWQGLLGRFVSVRYHGLVLIIVLLFWMQGAGITNWLVRSDPTWYWQQNPAASSANAAIKSVLDRVIYH